MKIRTRELTGRALDWAVAKCERVEVQISPGAVVVTDLRENIPGVPARGVSYWEPSTKWSQGGPIVERARIRLIPWHRPEDAPMHGYWHAGIYTDRFDAETYSGPTPLIAAMRCFVASKLGDEVDVPEELV